MKTSPYRITRAWPAEILDDGLLRPLPGLNEGVAKRLANAVVLLGIYMPDACFLEAELKDEVMGFTAHVCVCSDPLRTADHWLVTAVPA